MEYQNTLMWKELSETADVLSRIGESNAATLQKAVREVREKGIRNITGAARGTSDHALIYFKYLIEVFSPYKVALAACSAVTVYDGQVNYGDNLVVGVSQSGKAADVIAVLERAKSQGAVTVAITNNADSPMAKAAKYHLYCGAGPELSVAATKTFSAQAYLLACLAAALSDNKVLADAVSRIPEYTKSGFELVSQQSEKLADKLSDIRDGFVLARGISYALALESTLKLQETSYLLMKGYAESDFQHGPMAMVGEHTPIIIYAPVIGFASEPQEQAHRATFAAAIERLGGFGADVYVVTNSDKFDTDNVFSIGEEVPEPLAFFRLALLAQMLACRISCKRGNNPDSPRALNKVTITK